MPQPDQVVLPQGSAGDCSAHGAIVATGLQQCLAADGDLGSVDAKKMEKLFLSLA